MFLPTRNFDMNGQVTMGKNHFGEIKVLNFVEGL